MRLVPCCAQLMETKIPFLEIEQLKVKAEEAKTKVAEIVRQIQVRSYCRRWLFAVFFF